MRWSQYTYDANGNLLAVNTGKRTSDSTLQATNNRRLLWDEENRLLALSDNGFVSNYWYDAAGERTVKLSGDAAGVNVNGLTAGALTGTSNFTAYISPYMVVRNGGEYTKHIYMGSQRITSKLSNSGIFAASPVNNTDLKDKYQLQTTRIKERFDSLGVKYSGTEKSGSLISSTPSGAVGSYFYHSDHLGSSSLITDAAGNVTQHIEYVPFGEVFLEERNASWSTPYKFNGKEQDEETGLSYYGARYYDPRTSVWISVDPLAEKYPNVSPYIYCLNNPVKFVDPDGRKVYLFATTLPMTDGKSECLMPSATHTFILVTREGKEPSYYAYGGTGALSGQLGKREYTQDEKVITDFLAGKKNVNVKNVILVQEPSDMSSDEFDNKVIQTAESYGNNPSFTYDITGLGETSGNCNTSTSTILSKSGVGSKTLSKISDKLEGTTWGFGNIKPWTAQEQNEVSPQPRVTISLKLDNSIPVAVKDNTTVVQ